MKNLVIIFKALSDKNRVRIIKMLESRSLCLCEITAILNLAPSTVSKHLSILKQAGLIMDDKQGKWVNFRLNESPESVYILELLGLLKKWANNDMGIQKDTKSVEKVDRKDICGTD